MWQDNISLQSFWFIVSGMNSSQALTRDSFDWKLMAGKLRIPQYSTAYKVTGDTAHGHVKQAESAFNRHLLVFIQDIRDGVIAFATSSLTPASTEPDGLNKKPR